jgi:hypothetical protein
MVLGYWFSDLAEQRQPIESIDASGFGRRCRHREPLGAEQAGWKYRCRHQGKTARHSPAAARGARRRP